MTETWHGFRVVGAVEDDTAPRKPSGNSSELVNKLQQLLADVAIFYHTVHEFHWNVKGQNFYEYHKLLDKIVSDVYDSIDPIAENIRKLDSYARYSMSDLLKLASLKEVSGVESSTQEIVSDLVRLNSELISTLKTTFDTANSSNEQGVANFIAERIDMHQKWNWFLKSSEG